MSYLGIVIIIFILLYIVYRVYLNSNNYGAVRNSFLAKYTFDRLTEDQQQKVQEQTEELIIRGGGGIQISGHYEMVMYSFYALGMGELGIAPALPGEKWDYVKNPLLGVHGAKSQIQAIKHQIENKHKVSIDLKTPAEEREVMLSKHFANGKNSNKS